MTSEVDQRSTLVTAGTGVNGLIQYGKRFEPIRVKPTARAIESRGGGGYLTKFNTGRLRPEVQPLTLLYGTKASACHGRLWPEWESMGQVTFIFTDNYD